MRFQQDLERGGTSISGNYSQPLYGGTFTSGVRHNTRDGNTAVFFEYKLSW